MMIFHGYFRSSSAYRCRIAFNLKGVVPEQRFVHLTRDGGEQKSDAYRKLNPQALVPAVEFDDGAVITQSPAILELLDEIWPEPPLLPVDPVKKAQVRAFAMTIGCDIHPLQNLRVLQYLRSTFAADQQAVEAWCNRWIGDGLAACEALLARQSRQEDFCFGATPGLADIYLVPQVFSSARFKVDLSSMPNIRRIHENCEKLAAFADAHPSRQADHEE